LQQRKWVVLGVKGLEVVLGPDLGPCPGRALAVPDRLELEVANVGGLLGQG